MKKNHVLIAIIGICLIAIIALLFVVIVNKKNSSSEVISNPVMLELEEKESVPTDAENNDSENYNQLLSILGGNTSSTTGNTNGSFVEVDVTQNTEIVPSVGEQKIIDATIVYIEQLEIFGRGLQSTLEDYSNFFEPYRLGLVSGPIEEVSYEWESYQEKISNLQEDHTDFKDTLYRYEENADVRSAILDLYPTPSDTTYPTVPLVNDFFEDDLLYYSFEKLSNTLDYESFFETYGYYHSSGEEFEGMKDGLADASIKGYTSKVQCSIYSNSHNQKGCNAYVDAITVENQVSDIATILNPYM